MKQPGSMNIKTTEQSQIASNTKYFDLTTAYRLLIGAYIRSTDHLKQKDAQLIKTMNQTKQS